MKLVRYFSRGSWIRRTAAQMASVLEDALLRKGRAVMIAAGGSTPADIYAELGNIDLGWSGVTVIPSDERWVEETSSRSNIAMIKAGFSAGLSAAPDFHSLYIPDRAPDSAAPEISARLKDLLPADLCVLGMGKDMHTASLFPGAPELGAAMADDAPFAATVRMPGSGEQRMTLTRPALTSAGRIFLLIRGEEKLAALDTALESRDPVSSPVFPFLENALVHYAD